MPSTDIYQNNDRPIPKREDHQPVSSRRPRSPASFDETVAKDVSKTNRRRRRNSGRRRFQHLMRKPEFNRKFWIIMLSTSLLILTLLILWDRFFRYTQPEV